MNNTDTVAAPETAEDPADSPKRQRRPRSRTRELLTMVLAVLLSTFLIKTFLVQLFVIPSGSMMNTLQVGDRVAVDKFSPWLGEQPHRGEVVVFRDPGGWLPQDNGGGGPVQELLAALGLAPSGDERDLIKRVIAVGGDTVDCEAGKPLKVNGTALDEPYLYPGATPCGDDPVGTVTIPRGQLWVMGDHRNDSRDSRYQYLHNPRGGFVPVDHVIGRARLVVWPIGAWSSLPVPAAFRHLA